MAQSKTLLAPGLIHRHCHGIGQVQASASRAHRQAQALLGGQAVQHLGRQATAFRTEQESVAGLECRLVVGVRGLGGEGEQAWLAEAFQAAGQVGVALEGGILVVVQPGAAQALVVQFEADRLDQVQVTAAVGAQPYNIASIRRNFWLKEDDVKHARLRA